MNSDDQTEPNEPTELTAPTEPTASPTPEETPVEAEAAPVQGLPEEIPAALRKAMSARGFSELTSVQAAVLAAESSGRDVRISSQTGSGKTVAIGLALAGTLTGDAASSKRRGPQVLVLVPTRELAMQVRDELRWLFAEVGRIGVEVVMGGTSLSNERRVLNGRPAIVVGTPGRTLDHIQNRALDCGDIQHVVLDESDHMLDLGFRDELEAILGELPKERRTHLVSATFARPVQKLADRFQHNALHIEGTRLGDANADIEHVAHIVGPGDTYSALVNWLLLNEGGRCLIFVERRIDASSLAERLSGDGFPVQAFSGELPQAQRTRTLNAFRDGTIKTLVSTDVAARGIDVPNIELVIHADPPGDADTYVHRSGRTGRAGLTGRSVMLVPPRAQRYAERVHRSAKVDADWRPAPTASRVRKQLRRRFRQEIHERLRSEEAVSQERIDYAKTLLDGRDPAAVVALLLDVAEPKPAREPMDVREVRTEPGRAPTQPNAGYVRFRLNWGEKGGAAPNRILGHVCRRGKIQGHRIGAIDIGYEDSTFDVSDEVASQFEQLVQKPDSRDPKIRITRVSGGGGGGGQGSPSGHRPHKPRRKPFGPRRNDRG